MINRKPLIGALTCTLLALGRIGGAQTADDRITVPFSDPTRVGTVRVRLLMGSITVRPGSGRDVIVTTSRGRDDDAERRRERERERERDAAAAGLRRLTQPGGVTIQEENNTVSITAPGMVGRTNVTVEVPPATNLVLRTVNGGEVLVERINGSIEVNHVNGAIRLTDVGGAVVAHTTNGRVIANLRNLPAGTPMSFTSFNGSVDVTLPGAAKATLKLRSDRGDVFTDFDVQATQPPAGRAPDARDDRDRNRDRGRDPSPNPDPNPDPDRDARGRPRYRLERDRSIYGTINGGGQEIELRTFNGNVYLRKAK